LSGEWNGKLQGVQITADQAFFECSLAFWWRCLEVLSAPRDFLTGALLRQPSNTGKPNFALNRRTRHARQGLQEASWTSCDNKRGRRPSLYLSPDLVIKVISFSWSDAASTGAIWFGDAAIDTAVEDGIAIPQVPGQMPGGDDARHRGE
jgi:hypothetical protein